MDDILNARIGLLVGLIVMTLDVPLSPRTYGTIRHILGEWRDDVDGLDRRTAEMLSIINRLDHSRNFTPDGTYSDAACSFWGDLMVDVRRAAQA